MPKITYWIVTGLFALAMTGSGLANLFQAPPILESLAHLGFPSYLPYIIGPWKVLGVLAILAPGLPRLKEWAYAGFFFNLSGAFASHLLAGDAIGTAAPPLVIALLGVGSYLLRPEDRKLAGPAL